MPVQSLAILLKVIRPANRASKRLTVPSKISRIYTLCLCSSKPRFCPFEIRQDRARRKLRTASLHRCPVTSLDRPRRHASISRSLPFSFPRERLELFCRRYVGTAPSDFGAQRTRKLAVAPQLFLPKNARGQLYRVLLCRVQPNTYRQGIQATNTLLRDPVSTLCSGTLVDGAEKCCCSQSFWLAAIRSASVCSSPLSGRWGTGAGIFGRIGTHDL